MGDFDPKKEDFCRSVYVDPLPYESIPDDTELSELLSKPNDLSFNERLDAYSYRMVADEVPYVADPWGESRTCGSSQEAFFGAQNSQVIDNDPIFTFTGLDCVTYVLAVIALAVSKTSDDFTKHIIDLNYISGVVSFENRRHFIETDFLPLPYLNEATRTIMFEAPSIDVTIDRIAWLAKKGMNCDQTDDVCYQQDVSIHYIPLETLLNPEIQQKLPPFLFFALIRKKESAVKIKQFIDTELAIAHTGFIVKKGDQIVARHAACSRFETDTSPEPLWTRILRTVIPNYVKPRGKICVESKVFEEPLDDLINRKTSESAYAGFAVYEIAEEAFE